jgi:hypothetical protein
MPLEKVHYNTAVKMPSISKLLLHNLLKNYQGRALKMCSKLKRLNK